ncbi:MAG: 16S rRNA (cytosine(1402)-N(4))-methyltransferase RsmH [Planctomycetia bacterium]|nr:16S rRNA (cytosine(1402)-N(4))-methyltransferase RsmH [Planctomycetia bacterium]
MNGPTTGDPRHVPVLPAEVRHYLAPAPGQIVVDATAGLGGHSLLLAPHLGPEGRLLALDQDPAMLDIARARLQGWPVSCAQGNFDQLRQVLDERGIERVDAILADLGICSAQLDDVQRGFTFQQSGPLDMRMNPEEGEPARTLLKRLNERELADVFYHYGEERFSRRIARRIVETRRETPLETTEQLAELVRRCIPRPKGPRPTIDPATRVFQALRIAVNDELAALEGLLAALPRCLKPGGRAVLISFHSLEDRRVKQAFADRERWQALTKKPVVAAEEEVRDNPRSRSAKLRAAIYRPVV